MSKCVIIAGSAIENYEWTRSHIDENDFCIYCDSGLYHEEGLKRKPDLIIGDFDSHPKPVTDIETIKLPTEKDDTDSLYAVKEAIKRGYTQFVLIGVLGKRFDHSLGNLAILIMLEEKGYSGVIVDDYSEITLISGESRNTESITDDFKFFSVLCAGGNADGVTITGAKYNIENADLTMDFPIGVSNEVKKGDTAQVSVEHGRLYIIKIVNE